MMDDPMDDAAIEQYANWLDNLEKTDPEDYKQLIATMQSQLQTAGVRLEAAANARKDDTDAELYDKLKRSAGERRAAADTNSPEFKPRFPGDKVMGEDGLKATQEGMYIDVNPGFVMKTIDAKNKKKVFVNIVFANEIQAFSEKNKLDDEGSELEGIHVPLSLGAPHEVKDKMGVSSLAFDVAVNTKVVEGCQADKTGAYHNFVCQLAIEYIDRKYQIKLDERYKLPRLIYRGELPPPKHYIYKTQAPIIQEVTTKISAALKNTRTSNSTAKKVPKTSSIPKTATARFNIFEERKGDRVVCQRRPSIMKGSTPLSPAVLEQAGDRLIVSIEFENNVLTASDVELELQAELLSVKMTTHNDLEIFLPYPVDKNSARVCFNQVCNTMDVILTIDKSWDTLGPDCGSAPWLLARAIAEENNLHVSVPATTAVSDSEKPKTLVEMFQLDKAELSNDSSGLSLQAARQWDPVKEDKDVMSMHILEQRQIERKQNAKQSEVKRIQRRAEVEGMQKKTQETVKPWREMYSSEPEATYIDVEDIVRQEKSRLERHQQQQKEEIDPDKECMSMEDAKRVAAKWSENNKYGKLGLQSALAFGLL